MDMVQHTALGNVGSLRMVLPQLQELLPTAILDAKSHMQLCANALVCMRKLQRAEKNGRAAGPALYRQTELLPPVDQITACGCSGPAFLGGDALASS